VEVVEPPPRVVQPPSRAKEKKNQNFKGFAIGDGCLAIAGGSALRAAGGVG